MFIWRVLTVIIKFDYPSKGGSIESPQLNYEWRPAQLSVLYLLLIPLLTPSINCWLFIKDHVLVCRKANDSTISLSLSSSWIFYWWDSVTKKYILNLIIITFKQRKLFGLNYSLKNRELTNRLMCLRNDGGDLNLAGDRTESRISASQNI